MNWYNVMRVPAIVSPHSVRIICDRPFDAKAISVASGKLIL
ncbi:hypothetical protein [Nostoc sp.]